MRVSCSGGIRSRRPNQAPVRSAAPEAPPTLRISSRVMGANFVFSSPASEVEARCVQDAAAAARGGAAVRRNATPAACRADRAASAGGSRPGSGGMPFPSFLLGGRRIDGALDDAAGIMPIDAANETLLGDSRAQRHAAVGAAACDVETPHRPALAAKNAFCPIEQSHASLSLQRALGGCLSRFFSSRSLLPRGTIPRCRDEKVEVSERLGTH